MSASENTTRVGSADIEAAAAIWLQRRYYWDWSHADQDAFDAWITASTAHEVAYLRLKAGYRHTERLVALRAPRMEGRWSARLLRLAGAVSAVVIVGVAAMFYFTRPQDVTYTTAVGEHRTVMLADGSRVELNTDTVLRIRGGAVQRTTTLEHGEAYFQIRHDAAHPFVIAVAGHLVTDLGTKFLIRSDAAKLEVTLMEGRARVDADGASRDRSVTLLPGDDVVATAHSMSVTQKTAQEQESKLSWRRGVLIFSHAALADAANEYNRYNRDKIVVEGRIATALKVDGTLPTDDPQAFAEIAQDILHLHVEKRGTDIVISR